MAVLSLPIHLRPWPFASALIPDASKSIKLTVSHGGEEIASEVVQRPQNGGETVITINGLPAVAVTLEASAYPNEDGSGVAQARGAVSITLVANSTVSASITMDSTIDHLTCTPAALTVSPGQSREVTAGAFSAENELILTAGDNWTWSVSNGNASVEADGSTAFVAGITPGECVLTAKETESAKTVTVIVTVGSSQVPESYTISSICDLGKSSRAMDINNSGVTVGYFHENITLLQRPFVNRGSGAELLPTTNFPNFSDGIARAINDDGMIVGWVSEGRGQVAQLVITCLSWAVHSRPSRTKLP